MTPTIKEIGSTKPGCRRIEITFGFVTVEISQLGPNDLDGPGDIGIVPTPHETPRRSVVALLKAAPRHKLVTAALKALDDETADFYGAVPSRSVLAALDAHKRPSSTDIAMTEYKRKLRKRRTS